MPESLSIGFAYTPNKVWTLAIEATHIDYSRVSEEFQAPYAYPGGDIRVIQRNSDFQARDVVEAHLGLEYRTRFNQHPLALRAGYYFDPAHDIEYRGTDSTSQVIFPGGEDVQHISAGAGMLFRQSLQVDMAFDAADDNSYRVAISLAYRY
jgi:long-subunit fatty acid transport protein